MSNAERKSKHKMPFSRFLDNILIFTEIKTPIKFKRRSDIKSNGSTIKQKLKEYGLVKAPSLRILFFKKIVKKTFLVNINRRLDDF